MSESEIQSEESLKPRVPRLTAERSLPQASAEALVKIIKGYAVASNGGEAQVNYKDVASAAGIPPTRVSANNRFLEESEILTSPKYGFYLPSEGAVRFAREAAWDEAGAKAHLRRIVSRCWYGQVAIQNLTLRPSLSRSEFKKSLAIKCGASEGDSNALDFLIDFVVYTGLVEAAENGTLSRGNLDEVPQALRSTPSPAGSPASSIVTAGEGPVTVEAPKSGEVSLVIHLHVSSFEELTPDHASRLKQWMESLKGMPGSLEVKLAAGESQDKAD
ncbi:MAG: hypothetical protein AAB676_19085 [Verrucomicrobiota bacterium]